MRLFWLLGIVFCCAACDQSDSSRKLDFLARGNDQFSRKNYKQAENFYREALKIDSCYSPAWNNLGLIAYKRSDYGVAVLNFSNALQCRPHFFAAILNRARAFYDAGDEAQALTDVGRMKELKPDTSVAYFMEGLVRTRRTEFSQAVHAFLHSYQLDTMNAEVLINAGTALYFERKYDSANIVLQKAMKIYPDNPNAMNALALVNSGKGLYAEALGWIDEAIERDSSSAWFLNNRGFIYLGLGRLNDAISDIDQSLVMDEENGWAYRNKGLYCMKKGDYRSAARLFQRAIETHRYVEDVYLDLGDAYEAMGDKQKACEAWSQEKFNSAAADRLKTCMHK